MLDNTFIIQEPLYKLGEKLGYPKGELCYGLHPDRIKRLARLKDDTILVINGQTGDRFIYQAKKVLKCSIHPIPRDLYIVRESVMEKQEPKRSLTEEEELQEFSRMVL